LERERQFADLQSYKQQIVEQERENIIPQLVGYIQGNSREEIQASVDALKEQSASIMQDALTASQNARKEMAGTRATLPASGPMDTNMDSRQFSAQDIAAMSVNEYGKYRDRLISESARGKTRGILG
jgi:cation transport regulator ChaC